MSNKLGNIETPRSTVVAYALFAVCMTLFAIVCMLHEPLGEATVPYTGWNGGFIYAFTLWFAFHACLYAEPKMLKTLISFQKLFVVLGLFDFGLGYCLMIVGPDFDNPYLTYSPFHPLFSICVPVFWWHILTRHKRRLESTIVNEAEAIH